MIPLFIYHNYIVTHQTAVLPQNVYMETVLKAITTVTAAAKTAVYVGLLHWCLNDLISQHSEFCENFNSALHAHVFLC